jgi:HSP20 family molecular chaperone IbpA
MAKEPSKIKSFEAAPDDVPLLAPSPQPKPKPSLRRRKSIVTYRESGSDLVAVLDMQGFSKEDIHVSYQRDRLVVTWELVEILDVEESGHLVRERRQKVHTRHIDLPPGTKFDRVRAAMGSRHLVLRYPNPRYAQEPSMTVDEY